MSAERSYSARRIVKKAGLGLGAVIAAGAIGEVGIHEMRIHSSQNGSAISNFVRDNFGNRRAVELEGILFAYDDAWNRARYNIGKALGEEPEVEAKTPLVINVPTVIEETPGEISVPQIEKPTPIPTPRHLILPEIKPNYTGLLKDEGYWTAEDLPNPSEKDIVIAETVLHPRREFLDARVKIHIINKDRVTLHMTGGTVSPGDRKDNKVVGPGKIPDMDMPSLLMAWNGGFQGKHVEYYGMYADGKEYRPLTNDLASVVIYKDGTVKMGQWGRDFTQKTDDMIAVRQNSYLLVDNGEISPFINRGDVFGLVKEGDHQNFITWRSAMGLTENGDILVASGNDINQVHMANAMKAAGANVAMILDNNLSYVGHFLAYHKDGSKIPDMRSTMPFMTDPNRYFRVEGYPYDFFHTTLGKSNFR